MQLSDLFIRLKYKYTIIRYTIIKKYNMISIFKFCFYLWPCFWSSFPSLLIFDVKIKYKKQVEGRSSLIKTIKRLVIKPNSY